MDIENSKFLDRNSDINEKTSLLPHWHQDGKLQFVTLHLCDSLPQNVKAGIKRHRDVWLKNHPKPWSHDDAITYNRLFNKSFESILDSGYGECLLRRAEIADIVDNTLLHFNGSRYLLHAYVIMSNHLHVLYETLGDYRPETIARSWKQYTTRMTNLLLGRKGTIWSAEIYDRIIRDEIHYNNVIAYIMKNISYGGVRWMI